MGTRAFDIEEITHDPQYGDLVVAKVIFGFEDPWDDETVVQGVSFKVRLSCPESSTIEELHEVVYRKALGQIPRIISLCKGKTAKQLRADVVAQAKKEQSELDNWKADFSAADVSE
jgi:hypothetical protein